MRSHLQLPALGSLFASRRLLLRHIRVLACLPKRSQNLKGVQSTSMQPPELQRAQGFCGNEDLAQVSQEVQAFWRSALQQVDRPAARNLVGELDLAYPLGFAAKTPGHKSKVTRTPPCAAFTEETKRQHPTKAVLVRVGEFYEAMGTDAVLLMQWSGLNQMGNCFPPRAGCPVVNIRKTLQSLTDAGHSVVVCEEQPEVRLYGAPGRQRQRFIAGIVSPAQPNYMYGMREDLQDTALREISPTLGVAWAHNGFKVFQVRPGLRTCTVWEALTEDALGAHLFSGGVVPPVYLHSENLTPLAPRLSEASLELETVTRLHKLITVKVGAVERYSGDPVEGLLAAVCRDQGLPADTEFHRLTASTEGRPAPLFYSTVSQLGLRRTQGVPSLLDACIPLNAPQAARRWLSSLLEKPPSAESAGYVRQVVCFVKETQEPLPKWDLMSPSLVSLKLSAREGNSAFFRDLQQVLQPVLHLATSSGLQPLFAALLPLASEEVALPIQSGHLVLELRKILADIGATVPCQEGLGVESPTWRGRMLSATSRSSSAVPQEPPYAQETRRALFQVKDGLGPLGKLQGELETFHGRISPKLLQAELQQVAHTLRVLAFTLGRLLDTASTETNTLSILEATKPPADATIWLKVHKSAKKSSLDTRVKGLLNFAEAKDRNGKAQRQAFTTPDLDTALADYRAACSRALETVEAELQKINARTEERLGSVLAGTSLATVASALEQHTRLAHKQGWQLPTPSSGQDLQIVGVWPYWLDGNSPGTAKNDFLLDSMALLTGPNMAGKSTVLRTLCAVAVLGCCGLTCPATSASVPRYDAFLLRAFTSDSPMEGQSSFALEMREMRHVLENASAHSLVLVDELGKGTEVEAGSALCAALLEELATRGTRGVFATHLHLLLDWTLRAPHLRYLRMGSRYCSAEELPAAYTKQLGSLPHSAEWLRVPTWKVEEGSSRESLALNVALEQGIPVGVLTRAARFLPHFALASQQELTPPEQLPQFPAELKERVQSAAGLQRVWSKPSAGEACSPAKEQVLYTQRQGHKVQVEDALPMLRRAATACLKAQLTPEEGPSAWEDTSFLQVQVLLPGQNPSPTFSGRSCVYVLRRPDGFFYCGSTDDIHSRLNTHRKPSSPVAAGQGMEAAYVVLPSGQGGKTLAREVEAQAIKALKVAGFKLLSERDGSRACKVQLGIPQVKSQYCILWCAWRTAYG